jgi:uracil-DNA glycosylase
MHSEFFNRIAQPEHPALGDLADQARTGVENTLMDWGLENVSQSVVRNLSFTYYHDWEHDDPNCLLVIQDPGPLYDRHQDEVQAIRDLGTDPDPLELISLHRSFAISWLVQRNADFAEKFVETCDEHGIATPEDDWRDYIEQGRFFDDFYLADVVKYRTDSHNHNQRIASYRGYLRDEIHYVDPELVFVFGGDAWSLLRSQMTLTPQETIDIDPSKVTEAHGHPFRTTTPVETTIIPLVHFSGRVYHSLLRDSYFDYLEEGLATL